MATLLESIQTKYGADDDNDQEDYGWIVFVSNSPECKKGMFPPIMTLSDYDISNIGKLISVRPSIRLYDWQLQHLFSRAQWHHQP